MPDPTSERPSDMKRRAWKLLQEASAYASTLGGNAQREEKESLLKEARSSSPSATGSKRTWPEQSPTQPRTTQWRPRAHR